MSDAVAPRIAIVDYGLGNLYSVKHACGHVGLDAVITSSPGDILAADAVILPGVGAFGDAMSTLRRLGLPEVIKAFAVSGRPLVGICLGMQLLMSRSEEFGSHPGLDIVPGSVVRLRDPVAGGRRLKVPQIGWNGILRARGHGRAPDPWAGTLLDGIEDAEPVYFVHSYVVQPADPDVVLSTTRYGSWEFCSALKRGNVVACQFHPERSGPEGLRMYRNLARMVVPSKRRIVQ